MLLELRLLNFNSIKVRLEQISVNAANALLLFQFHKGAIRTNLASELHAAHKDFNSIKVRLEPAVLSDISDFELYFNSIKVRLEPSDSFLLYISSH